MIRWIWGSDTGRETFWGVRRGGTFFGVLRNNQPVDIPSDRYWWSAVLRAGIRADLDKQLRQPPKHLTPEQADVWLAGYDR